MDKKGGPEEAGQCVIVEDSTGANTPRSGTNLKATTLAARVGPGRTARHSHKQALTHPLAP